MDTNPIYDLTSGSISGTFEEAMLGVFNYGFRQSIFEVERLNPQPRGKAAQASGEVTLLRASATLAPFPLLKPGSQVHCLGLESDKSATPALYRIRRMAEGFGRSTMTELT